jgi:hypothetical protein
MNRVAILISGVVAFLLGVANIIIGQNLILPLPRMVERSATVPWYLTWAIVWLTALCAFTLSAFLISATVRKR